MNLLGGGWAVVAVAAIALLIGVRVGIWWSRSYRSAAARIDADIAFLRAMPAAGEGAEADHEVLAVQLCRTWLSEGGRSPDGHDHPEDVRADYWAQMPPREREAWLAVAQRARELAGG